MRRRGMTLIELIVSITLFVIIVTLATGGFIAITRLKTMMLDMKNSQQKARLIYETIYRSAKEATNVTVVTAQIDGENRKFLLLDYSVLSSNGTKAFDYSSSEHFYYYSCTGKVDVEDFEKVDTTCAKEDLLASSSRNTYNLVADKLLLDLTIPPTLIISLKLSNSSSTQSPSIDIDNQIILENMR